MNYARQFDSAIAAVVEDVGYAMSCSGGVDEDSDSASAVYSSPADYIRSIPWDQLSDEL